MYDIVLCVYERFRVDGDKNMHLLAFAFTIVFVWTGPHNHAYSHLTNVFVYNLHITIFSRVRLHVTRLLLLCTWMLLVCTRMLLVCSFSHDPILKQFTFQSPKFLQSFINNNKRRSLFPCLGASTSGSIPTAVVGEAERDRHVGISCCVTCSVITMKTTGSKNQNLLINLTINR